MSLIHLKKRIVSAKSICKITNAMKLMASGKLQKQKSIYAKIKDYYYEYYDLVGKLISEQKDLQYAGTKKLHIIVTSHLGLCGGYNGNVIKHALPQIKPEDKVLQIGKKGKDSILRNLKPDQYMDYPALNIDNFNYVDCSSLVQLIMKLLEEQKIDGVVIHYTKFINAITFSPATLSLLPFDEKVAEAAKANAVPDGAITYEPDKESIIKQLIPSYLSSVIYGALIESTISENSSRRNAMDTATDNSNDLIAKLELQYNRMRQAKITNEITEIISGSQTKE